MPLVAGCDRNIFNMLCIKFPGVSFASEKVNIAKNPSAVMGLGTIGIMIVTEHLPYLAINSASGSSRNIGLFSMMDIIHLTIYGSLQALFIKYEHSQNNCSGALIRTPEQIRWSEVLADYKPTA